MWLEAVTGFNEAYARMEQIAAERPGRYFVYCSETSSVVAHIERPPKAALRRKSKGSSA